jgi:hypothetical protein
MSKPVLLVQLLGKLPPVEQAIKKGREIEVKLKAKQ